MKNKNFTVLMFVLVVVLMLIGGIMSVIYEWSNMVNNTPVKFSDRWNYFISGPVYFIVPGVIIYFFLILKEKI